MTNKEELEETITHVISGIRGRSRFFFFTALLPYTNRKFDKLLERCIDLQKELHKIENDYDKLLDFQKKVYELEADYSHQRSILMFTPSVIFIYSGIALFFYLIKTFDILKFITTILGIDAPERLIVFGIAGAFLYLSTSLLSKVENTSNIDNQFTSVLKFSFRLFIAIVVPIVLVSLFFTKEGKIANMELSPELISFTCGYSSKLVVDIFNKLVEKGSKMLDAF